LPAATLRRIVFLHFASVFGLQLLLAGAAAPDPRVFLVDSDRALAPDGVVSIGWKNLPAGVEACELLLDIDGGRARLRITDELDPRTSTYPFRSS